MSAVWTKSSRSNGNGGNNCVEVARLGALIGVRDSKDPAGPILTFPPGVFQDFLNGAKAGDFDLE